MKVVHRRTNSNGAYGSSQACTESNLKNNKQDDNSSRKSFHQNTYKGCATTEGQLLSPKGHSASQRESNLLTVPNKSGPISRNNLSVSGHSSKSNQSHQSRNTMSAYNMEYTAQGKQLNTRNRSKKAQEDKILSTVFDANNMEQNGTLPKTFSALH